MTRTTLATLLALLTIGCSDKDRLTVSDDPIDTSTPAGDDDDDDDDDDTEPVVLPPEITSVRSELSDLYPTIVIVSWEQDGEADVHLEFSFEGETHDSPVRTLEAGAHEELLLGVPYGTEVTFEVVAETNGGTSRSELLQATTAEIPEDLPLGVLETSDPSLYEPSMQYVLTTVDEISGYGLGGRWWAMILDRQGRVVWAHASPTGRMIMHPRIGVDGDALLIDHNSYWGSFDGGVNSQILEMKIDGTPVQLWETPGLHHPFTQLPDGSIIYGAYTGGFGGYEESLVSVSRAGDYDEFFVCRDWLDSIGEFNESCGSNTITYHAPTNTLLSSWFTFETILEIDLSTNEVTRWFGHVNGAYGFDPPSSAFWYQHGGYITDAGTLLTSSHVTDDDVELVVREYEIDDGDEVLREVWSVGQGQEVTGTQMGEAHRLSGGNTLHNFGTNAHLREYTPDGTVVWEMDWALESTIGRSAPITGDLYALAPERP